jgi:hypothetical protein
LNFGNNTGVLGYGLRDSIGVMQFKDNAGQWTPFAFTRAFANTEVNFETTGLPNTITIKIPVSSVNSENVTINTLDSSLTIQSPGLYTITGTLSVANVSGSTITVDASIYKNSSDGGTNRVSITNNQHNQVVVSKTIRLVATDQISLRAAFSTTGPLIIVESGGLTLTKVSN